MIDLKMHQKVQVDGIPGFVAGIYPNGKGIYKGAHHAYYWIRTPSLDYLNSGPFEKSTYCRNGRAVSFDEMHRIRRSIHG